jgi:hypothetical protein
VIIAIGGAVMIALGLLILTGEFTVLNTKANESGAGRPRPERAGASERAALRRRALPSARVLARALAVARSQASWLRLASSTNGE